MRNNDNITEAVHGLDIFTKNWCMNCADTDKTNDLVFRCKECEFSAPKGICKIRKFASEHKSDYNMDDFGSMGSH